MHDLEAAKAVQRMQDYIANHITDQITLKQLGNAAGYSPWHAAKLFKETTQLAPFEYIRSLRLTKAALMLRDRNVRVLDVALDFVFNSHEGFTRAFSKAFGISPNRYSKDTPPIKLFLPQPALNLYRIYNKGAVSVSENPGTKSIFVQVVERPARKVLIKRGIQATEYFAYCEEVGCDVWSVLSSVKEALYEPIGMWLPEHLIAEGTSRYVQGVEVGLDYANQIPDGYELLELPPCTMMIFQGEPYEDSTFMEAIGEVQRHIDRFDPKLYGYNWAPESAPRFQLAPMGYRGYIEAIPVASLK